MMMIHSVKVLGFTVLIMSLVLPACSFNGDDESSGDGNRLAPEKNEDELFIDFVEGTVNGDFLCDKQRLDLFRLLGRPDRYNSYDGISEGDPPLVFLNYNSRGLMVSYEKGEDENDIQIRYLTVVHHKTTQEESTVPFLPYSEGMSESLNQNTLLVDVGDKYEGLDFEYAGKEELPDNDEDFLSAEMENHRFNLAFDRETTFLNSSNIACR